MSCSCNTLFSHPGKLLEVHLCNVGNTSRDWINKMQLNFDVEKGILSDVGCIVGLAHDLGKSTKSFQTYLLTEDGELKNKLKNNEETRHSPLGAFCGYYLVKEYIKMKCLNTEYTDFLPIAGFLTIQKHHGDLDTIISETAKYKATDINNYLNDIDIVSFERLLDNILDLVPSLKHCNYNWLKERVNYYETDMRKTRSITRNLGDRKDYFYYFITGLIFSILTDADKSDVLGLNIEYADSIIPGKLVDEYRIIKAYDKPIEEINEIRNEIYQAATDVAKVIEEEKHILSINVPTGTGKTLSVLSAALKIKELLYSNKPINRSIIYALPFTSIIDQNHQVFYEVFNKTTGQEPGNNILLKHHHLADVFYKAMHDDEYQEYSPLESHFIIEGWNSSIIATTFVQLFHSLITNRNAASRKLHRIANSIIILDEIQAIPHRYWQLLRQLLNYMAAHLDTYFILVTATLPLIFPKNEIFDLVSDKEIYFNIINRIRLDTHIEQIISIDEFKNIVIQEALSNKNKNILIVMNTIKSAQMIYEDLIKGLGEEDNIFVYLSSHVVPKERRERIEKIKKEKSKRKIVVSTQLIEAGVDVDFDIVFRDMGPLDSINQVAGRCNRNFRKDKGIVKIYYVKRSGRPDSSYIYDSTLLNATQKTLAACSTKGTIEEKNFYDLSLSYYKLLNQGLLSDTESQGVVEAVYSLNYPMISEFKLIHENYAKVDIFVEIDEEAKKVWNRFLRLKDFKDRWQRKEEFYRFKNVFQQYIISVQCNAKRIKPLSENVVGGILHMGLDTVDAYYKMEGKGDTGFITEEDIDVIW